MIAATTVLSQRESPAARPAEGPKAFLGPCAGSLALDQWRGLALILVLISHGFFFTNRVNGAGRIGVNLFFFISGILSYRTLLRSSDKSCGHLLRSFWSRRLRRLYPALTAYLGIMLVVTFLLANLPHLPVHSDLSSYLRALPWATFYIINYQRVHPYSMGHLWSLACEVQFYLVAPLLFSFGRGSTLRKVSIYGGVALAFTLFGLVYPLRSGNYELMRYHFEIAVWPMFVGFFCEFAKAWFMQIPIVVVRWTLYAGVIALMTALMLMPTGYGGKNVIVALGGLLLAPCLLAYLFDLPFPGKWGRSLAWVGERTYSIYLWQQPLTLCAYLPNLLQPIGAVLSLFVGDLSFRLFESPFLSARRSRQLASLDIKSSAAEQYAIQNAMFTEDGR